MSWVNNVRGKNPLYHRRCKYCRSELAVIDVKGTDEFTKSPPAMLCPRCDSPSPPIPLGANPNQEAPSD